MAHGQRTVACDGGNACAAILPGTEIPRHMPAMRGRGAPGRRWIIDWTDGHGGDEFVRLPRVSCNGSRRGRLQAAGAGRQGVPVRLCPRKTPPWKEDAERSGLATHPGWSANEIPSGVDGNRNTVHPGSLPSVGSDLSGRDRSNRRPWRHYSHERCPRPASSSP